MLTATPLYWDPSGAATASGGAGTWNTTTAQWRSGSATGTLVPWSNTGDANGPYQAVFPASGGSVTIGAAVTASSVSFTAAGYSLSGSTLTLAGGTGQVDVASGISDTIAAVVSGSTGLTKTSAGTLILTGTNSYTGGTKLNAGTLNINSDLALGAVPSSPSASNITFNGSASLQAGASTVSLSVNRWITIVSGFTATLDTQANTFTINGPIINTASTGVLSKGGTGGTLILAGTNSFVSGSTINMGGSTNVGAGLLELKNSNALGINPITVDAHFAQNNAVATLGLAEGVTIGTNVTYLVGGHQPGYNVDLDNISGNNTFNGNFVLDNTGGNYAIQSSDPSGTLTVGGSITDGITSTNRGLIFQGAGSGIINSVISNGSGSIAPTFSGNAGTTWTVNNGQTYSGVTTVNSGTLSLNTAQPLYGTLYGTAAGGSIIVNSGGTLLTNGVNSLEGYGNSNTSVTINAGAYLVNGLGTNHITNLTLAGGTIAGSSYGTNFGGFDVQSNDTINVTASSTISELGMVLESGASLNVAAGQTLTFSGMLIDSNAKPGVQLVKNGGGTLVLSHSNSYTGGTIVNAGTLQVGQGGTSGTMGSGTVNVFAGTTLILNRSDAPTFANDFSFQSGTETIQVAGSAPTLTGSLGGLGHINFSSGALVLTDSNVYAGGTTVVGGQLYVSNTNGSATGSGTVTVASGATLGGSGDVSGAVNVSSGAHLAPGNMNGTAGILNTGNLTLASGSNLDITLNGPVAGDDYDEVIATTLSLGGSNLNIGGLIGDFSTNGIPIISSISGTIQGAFAGIAEGATVVVDGLNFTASYLNGGSFTLARTGSTPTYGLFGSTLVSKSALISINSNHDLGNLDSSGNPVQDNQPDAGTTTNSGYRIRVGSGAFDPDLTPLTLHLTGSGNGSYQLTFNSYYISVWNVSDSLNPVMLQSGHSYAVNVPSGGMDIPLMVNGMNLTYSSATNNGGKLTASYSPSGGGTALADYAYFSVIGTSVFVDADNNNGYGLPDGSNIEGADKQDPNAPGKILIAATGDSDGDGVPDYADGYNLDGISGNADDSAGANDRFVPVVVQMYNPIDPRHATVRFDYAGSDPMGATSTTPAPGYMRLWLKDGSVSRNGAGVSAGGDYIEPGVTYLATELGLAPTSGSTVDRVTLWIEGIRPVNLTDDADRTISMSVDPDGTGHFPVFKPARFTVTVDGIQGPIVTTSTSALSFTSGSAPVAADSNITVVDGIGHQISGATISIGDDADDSAVLALASGAVAGISSAWDAGSSTLTLSGTASAASYQTALRMVTFSATGAAATKLLTFNVTDVASLSGQNTRNVQILASGPSAIISGPSNFDPNQLYTLTLSGNADGGPVITSWVINWGDTGSTSGQQDLQTLTGNPTSVTHRFLTQPGPFNISAVAYTNPSANPPSLNSNILTVTASVNTTSGEISGTVSQSVQDPDPDGVRPPVHPVTLQPVADFDTSQIKDINNANTGIEFTYNPGDKALLGWQYAGLPWEVHQDGSFGLVSTTPLPASYTPSFATVPVGAAAGFTPGDIYYAGQGDGKIYRLIHDQVSTTPFTSLPDLNGLGVAYLQFDSTGVFGGNLIVLTMSGTLYLVDAAGNYAAVASVPDSWGTGRDLSGVDSFSLTVLPDDRDRWGPYAGSILVGAAPVQAAPGEVGPFTPSDFGGSLWDVTLPQSENPASNNQNGEFPELQVTTITTTQWKKQWPSIWDLSLVTSNSNFYFTGEGDGASIGHNFVYAISAADLSPLVGDVLVCASNANLNTNVPRAPDNPGLMGLARLYYSPTTGQLQLEDLQINALAQNPNIAPYIAVRGEMVPMGMAGISPTDIPLTDAVKSTLQPVANRTIDLLNSQGNVVATTVTDASGQYSFNASAGNYKVAEVLPSGWVQNAPNLGASTSGVAPGYSISLAGGQAVAGIDFVSTQQSSIHYPPVIDSAPPTSIEVGTTVTYNVHAYSPDGSALTFDLAEHPDGMTLHQNGSNNATITFTAPYTPTEGARGLIRVIDSKGAEAIQPFTLNYTLPEITDIQVVGASAGAIDVSWNPVISPAVSGITGANVEYRVFVQTTDPSTNSFPADTWFNRNFLSFNGYAQYGYPGTPALAGYNASSASPNDPNRISYRVDVSNLNSSTGTYYVQVRAFINYNNSYGLEAKVFDTYTGSASTISQGSLAEPGGLQAYAKAEAGSTPAAIDLQWQANSDGVTTSYNIYRGASNSSSGASNSSSGAVLIGSVTPSSSSSMITYVDSNISTGTLYYYWVKAVNSGGATSSYSIPASAVLVNDLPIIRSVTASGYASESEDGSTYFVAGTTITLSAFANFSNGDTTGIGYEWDLDDSYGPPVRFSLNNSPSASTTLVTFQASGNYRFHVTAVAYDGFGVGQSAASELTQIVEVDQTLSGLEITSPNKTIYSQASTTFKAVGLDQFSKGMSLPQGRTGMER